MSALVSIGITGGNDSVGAGDCVGDGLEISVADCVGESVTKAAGVGTFVEFEIPFDPSGTGVGTAIGFEPVGFSSSLLKTVKNNATATPASINIQQQKPRMIAFLELVLLPS